MLLLRISLHQLWPGTELCVSAVGIIEILVVPLLLRLWCAETDWYFGVVLSTHARVITQILARGHIFMRSGCWLRSVRSNWCRHDLIEPLKNFFSSFGVKYRTKLLSQAMMEVYSRVVRPGKY